MDGRIVFVAGLAFHAGAMATWSLIFMRRHLRLQIDEWVFDTGTICLLLGLVGAGLLANLPRNGPPMTHTVRRRAQVGVVFFAGSIVLLFFAFIMQLLPGAIFLLLVPGLLVWGTLPLWSGVEWRLLGMGGGMLLFAHVLGFFFGPNLLVYVLFAVAALILAVSVAHPGIALWRRLEAYFDSSMPLPAPVERKP